MRRWEAGMSGDLGGIPYRVVSGEKFEGDLVIQWHVAGRWRSVPMRVGAILADFIFENEELAYPRSRGFKGGNRYLGYIYGAALSGWQKAEALLQEERRKRDERRVS